MALIGVYLLTAPVLAAVPAPRPAESGSARVTVVREMADGLRYVRRSRLLVSLIAVAFVALLGVGALSVLDVVFVTRALRPRAETAGVLFLANGMGQVVGGLVVAALSARAAGRYHLLLGFSTVVNGLALLGYALAPSLPVAVVALGLPRERHGPARRRRSLTMALAAPIVVIVEHDCNKS